MVTGATDSVRGLLTLLIQKPIAFAPRARVAARPVRCTTTGRPPLCKKISHFRIPRIVGAATLCLGTLVGAVACTDTPTALARAPSRAAERQTDNIDPYGGCPSAAVQQFYDYYGYNPDGISCTWGGSGWYIDISFYWDDYDPYFDWYQWLLSNSYTIDESCGDQILDGIIASYYNSSYYAGTEIPTCHEFNQTTSTQYFTHAELSQGNGTTWAWLKTALVIAAGDGYGADQWRTEYGGPRTATSGYRTPEHNHSVGGATDSRHMHGDALDLNNDSGTQTEWNNMFYAAQRANADYIEPQTQSGMAHVHADWRNH